MRQSVPKNPMFLRFITGVPTFIIAAMVAGCGSGSGDPIEIIVPDSYRGAFTIAEDPIRGVSVPLVNGRYSYIIPKSGSLVVKDMAPFERWHTLSASYKSGDSIRVNYDANPAFGGIMLTDLGTGDDRTTVFLVGDARDVRRAYEDRGAVEIGNRSGK